MKNLTVKSKNIEKENASWPSLIYLGAVILIKLLKKNQYDSSHHENKGDKSYDFSSGWRNAFNKTQNLCIIKKKKLLAP